MSSIPMYQVRHPRHNNNTELLKVGIFTKIYVFSNYESSHFFLRGFNVIGKTTLDWYRTRLKMIITPHKCNSRPIVDSSSILTSFFFKFAPSGLFRVISLWQKHVVGKSPTMYVPATVSTVAWSQSNIPETWTDRHTYIKKDRQTDQWRLIKFPNSQVLWVVRP